MFRASEGAPARTSFGLRGRSVASAAFLAIALVACAGDEASFDAQDDQRRDIAAKGTPEAEHLPQLVTRPSAGQIGPIRNVASGKCLDASDYGRGLQIIQYDCLGNDNQQWRVRTMSGSSFALINVKSGKCLDASDYGRGENVVQWDCTYEPHQLWTWASSPRGIKIVNAKSGKCLDASDYGRGERVIQYDCLNAHANQQWLDEVKRNVTDQPDRVEPRTPNWTGSWYDVRCECSFGVFPQKQLCFLNSADVNWAATTACDDGCRKEYQRNNLSGPASSRVLAVGGPKGSCNQDFANCCFQ